MIISLLIYLSKLFWLERQSLTCAFVSPGRTNKIRETVNQMNKHMLFALLGRLLSLWYFTITILNVIISISNVTDHIIAGRTSLRIKTCFAMWHVPQIRHCLHFVFFHMCKDMKTFSYLSYWRNVLRHISQIFHI